MFFLQANGSCDQDDSCLYLPKTAMRPFRQCRLLPDCYRTELSNKWRAADRARASSTHFAAWTSRLIA
jgi:hypothetical protein